jgi:hypothetical protein
MWLTDFLLYAFGAIGKTNLRIRSSLHDLDLSSPSVPLSLCPSVPLSLPLPPCL